MNFRFIIVLSWFLITGCVSNYLIPDVELKARNHMSLAESKQLSSHIVAAIKEYTFIYKKYRDTSYLKPAVLKLALLNIHPDNPVINYISAQDWLQIYLGLHLSPEEEGIALILTRLIRQTHLIQNENEKLESHIKQHKNGIITLTGELEQAKSNLSSSKSKFNACEAQLSILKKNFAVLNNKLQKLKEIDVQMHKTKKTHSVSSPKSN